jgi:hypothetical protein
LGFQFFNNFFSQVVTVFVILDPVATVPVFLAVTAGLERRRRLLVAVYALAVAFLVMLFFIIVHRRRRRDHDGDVAVRLQDATVPGAGDDDRHPGAVPGPAVRRVRRRRCDFPRAGPAGIEIVSRVFGLILASIAITNNMIAAIELGFGLA